MSQASDAQESIAPNSEPVSDLTGSDHGSSGNETGGGNARLIVWGGLSLLWLGYLALGQVNARFWVLGQFNTDYKAIRDIWRVELGSLPGGDSTWMIQALVLTSIVIFVVGVIGGLYLILVPGDARDEAGEL